MGFFDYIKGVLSDDCCQEEGELISKEPLVRSDDFRIKYSKWLKTDTHQTMMDCVQHALKKRGGCPSKKDKSVCFIMIPTINGFTMHFNAKRWEQDDFRYFFEYLKDTLLKVEGFENISSTEEKIKFSRRTERVKRFSFKNSNPQEDYSSVLIRLCYTNQKVSSIKFCATCAIGTKPDFASFIEKLAVG